MYNVMNFYIFTKWKLSHYLHTSVLMAWNTHTTFCVGSTVVKICLTLLWIRSDPKHIFSRPYIEMLARRSKVDPLSDCPLGDGWKVVELDLDSRMSAALVKCFFTYRGEAGSLCSSKRFV